MIQIVVNPQTHLLSTFKKFTKAYLHELLVELISEHSLSNINEVDNAKNETDTESLFVANSTYINSINPGDISELMYSLGKGKLVLTRKKIGNHLVTRILKKFKTYLKVG